MMKKMVMMVTITMKMVKVLITAIMIENMKTMAMAMVAILR